MQMIKEELPSPKFQKQLTRFNVLAKTYLPNYNKVKLPPTFICRMCGKENLRENIFLHIFNCGRHVLPENCPEKVLEQLNPVSRSNPKIGSKARLNESMEEERLNELRLRVGQNTLISKYQKRYQDLVKIKNSYRQKREDRPSKRSSSQLQQLNSQLSTLSAKLKTESQNSPYSLEQMINSHIRR